MLKTAASSRRSGKTLTLDNTQQQQKQTHIRFTDATSLHPHDCCYTILTQQHFKYTRDKTRKAAQRLFAPHYTITATFTHICAPYSEYHLHATRIVIQRVNPIRNRKRKTQGATARRRGGNNTCETYNATPHEDTTPQRYGKTHINITNTYRDNTWGTRTGNSTMRLTARKTMEVDEQQ